MSKGRELFSPAISSPCFFGGGEWRFPTMAASAENDKDASLCLPCIWRYHFDALATGVVARRNPTVL